MLHKKTISQPTLELLGILMQDHALKDFFLAGGTALSLQIGHRISVDLDLFIQYGYDEKDLLADMENRYHFLLDFQSKNTLKGEIKGIKVDLIAHQYPLVKALMLTDGLRLSSFEDIAAMKLNAIAGNGTRLKDFIDIAYLSSYLTLAQMVDAYHAKYSTRNPAIVIKSLNYHKDIDFNEPIQMVSGIYSWEIIAARLSHLTKSPETLFEPLM